MDGLLMVCFLNASGIFHVAPLFEKQSQVPEGWEMPEQNMPRGLIWAFWLVCVVTLFYEVIKCLFLLWQSCDRRAFAILGGNLTLFFKAFGFVDDSLYGVPGLKIRSKWL